MPVNKKTASAASRAPPAFRPVSWRPWSTPCPKCANWLHELKYDGYRILLSIRGDKVRAFTRSGLDWAEKFPSIVEAAKRLKITSALIDGEAVVLDERGRSRFQLIQGAFKGGRARIFYYAFDLIEVDDEDLSSLPLIERKNRLAKVVGRRQSGVIRYSDHVVAGGAALFASACKDGLEGIVSKKVDAPYLGVRSEAWLKVKCLQRQEFIIAGWTKSDKDRGFRSLILGACDKGELKYAGKVGTGFNLDEITRLRQRMRPLERAKPTLTAPRAAVRGAHWVAPKLVAEIAFTEMTADGVLRHSSYLGLRGDKEAKAVVFERPKHLKTSRKRVPK